MTLAEIDAEIAATAKRLYELRIIREEAREAQIQDICRRFDAGSDIHILVKETGIPKSSLQGILWRAGRTLTGRRNTRARIREYTSSPSDGNRLDM